MTDPALMNSLSTEYEAVLAFLTGSGRTLTQGYQRRKLLELGMQAEIHKRVHAHGLQHTHVAELRSEGVDVAVIKRQLGHTSLLTTIRYLDHLEPMSVVEAITE